MPNDMAVTLAHGAAAGGEGLFPAPRVLGVWRRGLMLGVEQRFSWRWAGYLWARYGTLLNGCGGTIIQT